MSTSNLSKKHTATEEEKEIREVNQSRHIFKENARLRDPNGKPVMKFYDIYMGYWTAREYINNPFTGARLVTRWEFQPTTLKPSRAGVCIPEGQAEFYNSTRQTRNSGMHCDQLMPAGELIRIYFELDEMENPFKGSLTPLKVPKTW